ncbi:MAG: hypothetical protein IPM98_18315 [Lewinellaceae bacterium]|nr:hypothetical protein [Lewinellaceae bacterium]
MKKRLALSLLGIALLLVSPPVHAQDVQKDTAGYLAIRTSDGNEFVGKVITQDSAVIVLQTNIFAEITIRREAIRRMRPVSQKQTRSNKYLFETASNTHYFIGQNAYGLRKGEGYYQNGWIFLNQFAYGLSDHFSIGVGAVPFLGFETDEAPIWIQPKISIPLLEQKVHVSITGIVGRLFSSYEEDAFGFGGVLGQVTYGSPNANLSAGVGSVWGNGSWTRAPLFSIGGMVRTAPRFALISENYFVREDGDTYTIAMLGFRAIGRRASFDFGLLSSLDEFDAIGIPWIGLQVPIGPPR